MTHTRWLATVASVLLLAACSDSPAPPVAPEPPGGGGGGGGGGGVPVVVPAIDREFRGMWIATVANIDWPSRSGLSTPNQQSELIAILDRAQTLKLNAVILQIRPAGDALYASDIEPWTRSLTGTQGVSPGWDPLTFAVEQAHARGIELHAWFNPFRAGNLSDSLSLASNHFAKQRPDLTRPYCTQRWFDPGEPEVHARTYRVIRDVVARYDIDAVHLDDFFYPYPDSRCAGLQFPDSAVYARFVAGGGTMSRDDWRRDNVNRFVQQLQQEVRQVDPTVRVGISPFGIWRPGTPPGIVGLDAYGSIFADSRLWLNRGWIDYLSPQLYWALSSTGQNFTALLDWWTQQNTQQRHLWPGLASYRVADGSSSAYAATEIQGQINATRQRATAAGGPTGTILYNTTSVMQNRGGLSSLLESSVNVNDAVVPASPWLDATVPAAPTFTVASTSSASGTRQISIAPDVGGRARWWLVRWRDGTRWRSRVMRSALSGVSVPGDSNGQPVRVIVVHALSATGVASSPTTWQQP